MARVSGTHNGVFNGSDTTGVGAAQAVLAAGPKVSPIMTATDFQIDTEKFMREGIITMAVLQSTVTIGRWGIRAAVNHLEGRRVPGVLATPLLVATKENLDTIDMAAFRAPAGWTPPAR